MGRHLLVCGDAREAADYDALTSGELIDCIFAHPPYNCPVDGHVCGLGKTKHREFAMAAGEMTQDQFTAFLASTLGLAALMLNSRWSECCVNFGNFVHGQRRAASIFSDHCFTRRTIDTVENVVSRVAL